MPVNKPTPEYELALPRWVRCRDAHDGQDCVKAKTTCYLPLLDSHSGDSDQKYIAYRDRAMFYNGTGRTVEALTGAVFRKDPELKESPALKDVMTDITLTGQSFLACAMEVFEETVKVGRVGVLVDWFGGEDATGRPYFVKYLAEQIINWRAPAYNGKRELELLVLREVNQTPDPTDPFTPIFTKQYRVLKLLRGLTPADTIVTSTVWTEHIDAENKVTFTEGAARPLIRRGAFVPFIPFVFMPDIDVEKPPLLDLVDVNMSLYRTSADLEHGRHFTALPQAWVVGAPEDATLTIGSSEAWVLESAAHSKAGFLEFTGQGLKALETAEDSKKKMMAVLGARLLEEAPTVQDTATAVEQRQSGDFSVLKRLALKVSTKLTVALQWATWWMGATDNVADPNVELKLNTDFIVAPMEPAAFTALVNAMQSGAISHHLFWHALLKGEHVPPGWTQQNEEDAIKKESEERSQATIKEQLAITGVDPALDEDEELPAA